MKQNQVARVVLNTAAWKTILLDAYQRQEIEACGVLLGKIDHEENWHIVEAAPLRNIYASPVYFEFDPAELLAMELEQPGRIIGVYHSHPAGPATASSIDRRNMQRVNAEQHIPWIWLIVSGPFTSMHASETPDETPGKNVATGINAGGVIAYHHYEDTGLQQIAIQRSGNEDTRPA